MTQSRHPTAYNSGIAMDQARIALNTIGCLAVFGSLIQLIRLVTGFELIIGPWYVPVWAAAPGFVIDVSFAAWMFWTARQLETESTAAVV